MAIDFVYCWDSNDIPSKTPRGDISTFGIPMAIPDDGVLMVSDNRMVGAHLPIVFGAGASVVGGENSALIGGR